MSSRRSIGAAVRAAALMALAVGALGCFSDPPPVEQDCGVGEELCRCNAEQACFSGLLCYEGEVCISDQCEPGAMNCPCENGVLCSAGLECNELTCRPRMSETEVGSGPGTGDTSTSGTSMSSTTASSTASTSSSTTAGTTGTTTTAGPSSSTTAHETDETTETDSSDTGDHTSTTGPMECENGPCGACVDCVSEDGAVCGSLDNTCASSGACRDIVDCMETCADFGLCIDDCCAGQNPTDVGHALNLRECWLAECTACTDELTGCGG